MPPACKRSAIIAGAGIGGLTSALSLAKAGYVVDVFEQAPRLDAVGAGIQLSPNALDVLDRLGLSPEIRRIGIAAQAVTLRSGRSGKVLAEVSVSSDDGRGYRAMHRADLQAVLLAAVEAEPSITLHLGHQLSSLDDKGKRVHARFQTNGSPCLDIETSLFIAADGVHSAAARFMNLAAPKDSGMVAVRMTIDAPQTISPDHRIEAWLGASRHAVSYPITCAGLRNLVLIVKASNVERMGFEAWAPSLRDLIGHGTGLGSWPLLTVDPAPRMAPRPRIVFVGDAAHAMLPFAAQGAAMAIEDGWMLAVCLSGAGSIEEGLRRFSALRLPRIAKVLKRVSLHRLVYHLLFPFSLGRDAALTMRPPASLRRDLGWLYDWRAPDMAALAPN